MITELAFYKIELLALGIMLGILLFMWLSNNMGNGQ